jgi:hypothetical protein
VSQVLSNRLQNNPLIKGLVINSVDILMSLFADDTDLYLDPSTSCVDAVVLELNLFGQHSGCKPNISKTKCIPLGAPRNDNSLLDYLTSTYDEDIVANSFTALGVNFDNTANGPDICKQNYLIKLSKASSAVSTWSKRDLPLLRKCTYHHQIHYPFPVHLFHFTTGDPPASLWASLNAMFYCFALSQSILLIALTRALSRCARPPEAYLAAKQPRHEVRVSTWLGESC